MENTGDFSLDLLLMWCKSLLCPWWDGWMASLTQWTWVSVKSGSWWWTGRPGMLRFMGLQTVGHDWVTELNWTENKTYSSASRSLAGTRDTRGWSLPSSLALSGVDGFKILLTSPERVTITLFKDRGRLIADYTFPVTWKKMHFMRTQGHKK